MKLLAVDGFNLIRRVYEARQASRPEDMASVIDAARRSLERALNAHAPTHAAVILEDHDRTWRHLLYPDYKGNRGETPSLLIDYLDKFVAAFEQVGVMSCNLPSYEADDVIATMTRVVEHRGGQVVILSTDRIFLQLLNPRVIVFDHFNEQRRDVEFVAADLGLKVDSLIDYLALVGDKSNNVKGVPGIGPKSAVTLLREYGTLDQLLASDSEDRLVAKVQDHRDEALRCRQLVTLKTDVELGLNLKTFRYHPQN